MTLNKGAAAASDFCCVQRAPKRPGLPTPQEGHDFIGDRLDLGTIKRHSWPQGTPLDSCRLHRDDSFAHHRRCLKQLQGEARGRGVMMHPMLVFELERIFACEVLDAAVGIQVDLLTFARSCAPSPPPHMRATHVTHRPAKTKRAQSQPPHPLRSGDFSTKGMGPRDTKANA